MTVTPETPEFDARIRRDQIPADGRPVTVKADEEQRAALARRFNVTSVEAFGAEVTASRFKGGVRVQGRVHGTVIQPCTVSGEPVTQYIDEPVDRVFLPGKDRNADAAAGSETWVNLEDDAFPDYFEGNEIDLSDMLMEVFAMAIDLYPRAPGAELDPAAKGDDPANISPFSVLKGLGKT